MQNLTTPRGDYVSLPPRKYVELDVISPKSNAEPTGSPRCRIRGHCLREIERFIMNMEIAKKKVFKDLVSTSTSAERLND